MPQKQRRPPVGLDLSGARDPGGSYVNEDYVPSAAGSMENVDGMSDIPLDDLPPQSNGKKKTGDKGNAASPTTPHTPDFARMINEHVPTLDDFRKVQQQITDVTNQAGRAIATGAKEGLKTLTSPMELSEFGWLDIITALVSIGLFYFDIISDSTVVYSMRTDEKTKDWFYFTLIVMVAPLCVVNAFSLYWYWFDAKLYKDPEGQPNPRSPKVSYWVWAFRIFLHFTLQGSVLRYCDLLFYGKKSVYKDEPPAEDSQENNLDSSDIYQVRIRDGRDHGSIKSAPSNAATEAKRAKCHYYQKLWIHAERDAANVDLMHSLVQDAPQLMLQLHIISETLKDQQGLATTTSLMQVVSICGSLIALAFAVGSFARATRLGEPTLGNLSPMGLITVSLAHFTSIAPQVLCFALFSTKFVIYFIILLACHWLCTSTLLLFTLLCCPNPVRMGATFTHDMTDGPCHRADDIFFSAAFGMVLLYTFVDVGAKNPKITGGVYHFFRLVEECVIVTFWYNYTDPEVWFRWVPLVLVPFFFVLSVIFTSLYFFCTHPDSKRKPLFDDENS